MQYDVCIWSLSDYNEQKDTNMPLEINIFLCFFSVLSKLSPGKVNLLHIKKYYILHPMCLVFISALYTFILKFSNGIFFFFTSIQATHVYFYILKVLRRWFHFCRDFDERAGLQQPWFCAFQKVLYLYWPCCIFYSFLLKFFTACHYQNYNKIFA